MTPVPAVPGKNIKNAVDGNSSLSEALAKGASAPVTRITVLVRKPLLVSEVVFSRLVNKSADQFVTAIEAFRVSSVALSRIWAKHPLEFCPLVPEWE